MAGQGALAEETQTDALGNFKKTNKQDIKYYFYLEEQVRSQITTHNMPGHTDTLMITATGIGGAEILYLSTFGTMENHQTVALSALGGSSQFSQLMGLSSFGHQSVSEGAGRTGCLCDHVPGT